MTRRCLLVIDLLNEYLDRWEPDAVDRLISAANRLVAAFHACDLPVIFVRQEFRPDLADAFLEMRDKAIHATIAGTRGAAFHPALDRRSAAMEIVKKRYSAFFGTDLDRRLERLGIEELTIAGINTHACIRMTAIDAYQRDYRVVLASEAIGSYDERHARVTLDYLDGKIARLARLDDILPSLRLPASPTG
ncbi:cysteine hydrolase family protein [Jiella sp. M17.18]|uniref:cysteine hydrolase family protein n=1 Tax=Jiella sp. M17.18 TaxID=3234247 RepID=UPI0034DE4210